LWDSNPCGFLLKRVFMRRCAVPHLHQSVRIGAREGYQRMVAWVFNARNILSGQRLPEIGFVRVNSEVQTLNPFAELLFRFYMVLKRREATCFC